jgi:hypothetical protein
LILTSSESQYDQGDKQNSKLDKFKLVEIIRQQNETGTYMSSKAIAAIVAFLAVVSCWLSLVVMVVVYHRIAVEAAVVKQEDAVQFFKREEEISKLEAELVKQKAEVNKHASDVSEREAKLSEREAAVATLKEREAAVVTRENQVSDQVASMSKREDELREREAAVAARENQVSELDLDAFLETAWTHSSSLFEKRPDGICVTANGSGGYQLKYKIPTKGVAKVIVELGHVIVTKGYFYFGIRKDTFSWVDQKRFAVGQHFEETFEFDVEGDNQLEFLIYADSLATMTMSQFRIVLMK